MKIMDPLAAITACVCSKLLCGTCLFLLEENEMVLSTVTFALAAAAALLAAWFLDATVGNPVTRAVLRIVYGPKRYTGEEPDRGGR